MHWQPRQHWPQFDITTRPPPGDPWVVDDRGGQLLHFTSWKNALCVEIALQCFAWLMDHLAWGWLYFLFSVACGHRLADIEGSRWPVCFFWLWWWWWWWGMRRVWGSSRCWAELGHGVLSISPNCVYRVASQNHWLGVKTKMEKIETCRVSIVVFWVEKKCFWMDPFQFHYPNNWQFQHTCKSINPP